MGEERGKMGGKPDSEERSVMETFLLMALLVAVIGAILFMFSEWLKRNRDKKPGSQGRPEEPNSFRNGMMRIIRPERNLRIEAPLTKDFLRRDFSGGVGRSVMEVKREFIEVERQFIQIAGRSIPLERKTIPEAKDGRE